MSQSQVRLILHDFYLVVEFVKEPYRHGHNAAALVRHSELALTPDPSSPGFEQQPVLVAPSPRSTTSPQPKMA